MKLIGIMHVKNAIRTIEECLGRFSELVDEIIIVDNGSTDNTIEVYQKFPKIVKILHTVGYHGGRDVRLLLEEAKKRNPDWIMLIDSDEVFERHLTRRTLERYMRSRHDIVTFRMYNFWLSRNRFRVDRNWLLYTVLPQRHMWRNLPSTYFQDIKVHYGHIQGLAGSTMISPYRIKHYGYTFRDEIERKMQMYKSIDVEKDYATLDPGFGRIVRMPFVEFHSKVLNRIFIALQDVLMQILAAAIAIKRTYLRGFRFFSQHHD